MYSAVLLMALSTGGDSLACHCCHGGCYGGCYGGWYGGCYGGGCYGGGCYGGGCYGGGCYGGGCYGGKHHHRGGGGGLFGCFHRKRAMACCGDYDMAACYGGVYQPAVFGSALGMN